MLDTEGMVLFKSLWKQEISGHKGSAHGDWVSGPNQKFPGSKNVERYIIIQLSVRGFFLEAPRPSA